MRILPWGTAGHRGGEPPAVVAHGTSIVIDTIEGWLIVLYKVSAPAIAERWMP